MKKILLLLSCIILSIYSYAQVSFLELPSYFTSMPLPCDDIEDSRPGGALDKYGLIALKENPDIPLRQYTNFQCTEWRTATFAPNDILAPTAVMMIDIPGREYKLYSILIGGISDALTYYLVIVDSRGEVSDVMEGLVCWGPPAIYAKQTRIDKDFNITVYSIHAETTTSLPTYKVPSFCGWREDVNYRIINGKFVKTDMIRYRKRVFNNADLAKNIWLGYDVPI